MVIVRPQRKPIGLKQLGRSLQQLDYIVRDPLSNLKLVFNPLRANTT